MRTRFVFAFLTLLGATPLSGCYNYGCGPDTPGVTCAESSGSAIVSAPAELGLVPTLPFDRAQGCLSTAGDCSNAPTFVVGTRPSVTGNALSISVTFPATARNMTFSLPSSDVIAHAIFSVGRQQQELPVTGTLSVEDNQGSGFRASFDLQMTTAEGQVITVTGGQASVDGCRVESFPARCD